MDITQSLQDDITDWLDELPDSYDEIDKYVYLLAVKYFVRLGWAQFDYSHLTD